MGGTIGGLGHVGRGQDACEGVRMWVDRQVGGVVMGQHGCGAAWLGLSMDLYPRVWVTYPRVLAVAKVIPASQVK